MKTGLFASRTAKNLSRALAITCASAGFAIHAMPCFPASPQPLLAQGTWIDDSGQRFDAGILHGRQTVVAMAYASCRIVCPMTFARMSRLQAELDEHGANAEFVIVSFPGPREKPAAWHHFRASHKLNRPNWHFLVGNAADTQAFANTLGFSWWLYDEHVMHEPQVLVFAADGKLLENIDVHAPAAKGPDGT